MQACCPYVFKSYGPGASSVCPSMLGALLRWAAQFVMWALLYNLLGTRVEPLGSSVVTLGGWNAPAVEKVRAYHGFWWVCTIQSGSGPTPKIDMQLCLSPHC